MKKKKKIQLPLYLRLGVVDIEEFLKNVPLDNNSSLPTRKIYFGKNTKVNNSRYIVYARKGVQCAHCGIKGTFFALEQSLNQKTNKFHFNLYAGKEENKKKEDEMMTVDHIKPTSKGGLDILENKQVLCFTCNNKKGDKLNSTIVK